MANNLELALDRNNSRAFSEHLSSLSDIATREDLDNIVVRCISKDTDFVKALLSEGFSPNRLLHPSGESLLHLAIRNHRRGLVRQLIEGGGDTNLKTLNQCTPLELCLLTNNLQLCNLLLQNAANPNGETSTGAYPLHLACRTRSIDLLNSLLSFGADPSRRDAEANLPIHVACLEGHLDHVQALFPLIGDVDSEGKDGDTLLHSASQGKNWSTIHWLLNKDADMQRANFDGNTPLDIILNRGHKSVLSHLATHFTHRITISVSSVLELLRSTQFNDFVRIVAGLDRSTFYLTELEVSTDTNSYALGDPLIADDTSQRELLQFFADVREKRNVADKLNDNVYIERLCSLIVQNIIAKEDKAALIFLISEPSIWKPIEQKIIERVDKLYLWSIRGSHSVGALDYISAKFVSGNNIDMIAMYKWTANLTRLDYEKCFRYQSMLFQNPLCSIVTWAVLAEKLGILELLLRLNHLDIIPFALYVSNLLTTLSRHDRISYFTRARYEELALSCENVAVSAITLINNYDSSPMKKVCIQFLRCDIANFGGVTCLDLAANGESPKFLQLKLCQRALDIEWYQSLYEVWAPWREMLIVLASVPFNIIVPMILVKLTFRIEDKANASSYSAQDIAEDNDGLFLMESVYKSANQGSMNVVFNTTPVNTAVNNQSDMVLPSSAGDSLLCEKVDTLKVKMTPYTNESPRYKKLSFCDLVAAHFDVIKTPAVKFRFHAVSLFVFLFIFSYVVMLHLRYPFSPAEVTCYVFMLGFLIEELYELAKYRHNRKCLEYFTATWNIVDMIGLSFGFLGFGLRLFCLNDDEPDEPSYIRNDDVLFYFVRVALCISLLFYYLKLISLAAILQKIGPKIKMMSTMVWKDFMPFLFILFVFMTGFGVVFQALLYPDGLPYKILKQNDSKPQPWNASYVLQSMVKLTFYSMMGDFQLDRIEGEDCTDNCPHPIGAIVVPVVFMIVYVIITNILLLNLVIALFSKTVEDLDSCSQSLWEYERYSIVQEYVNRSAVPPPLNIIHILWNSIALLMKHGRIQHVHKQKLDEMTPAEFMYFLIYQACSLRQKRLNLGNADVKAEPNEEVNIGNEIKKLNDITQTLVNELTSKI